MTELQEQGETEPQPAPVAEGDWFRAPSRRERLIAAGLFLGFGLFFVLLFFLNRGWWFRWVILGLAVWSLVYAIRHARDARRAGSSANAEQAARELNR